MRASCGSAVYPWCVCVCARSGTASLAFRAIWAARQPHKTCLCVRICGCLSYHSSPVQGFSDPDVQKKKLNSELANGRLAMMAIIGMFFQDGLTGYLAKFCKAIPTLYLGSQTPFKHRCSKAQPGATGPTTPSPRCEPSRTSSGCRRASTARAKTSPDVTQCAVAAAVQSHRLFTGAHYAKTTC